MDSVNWRRTTRGRMARGRQVSLAFLSMAFQQARSYPLAFVLTQLQATVGVVTYYFVGRLVGGSSTLVAGDYFTFVVTALFVTRLLGAAMQDLISELDQEIQQGSLEMLLVEPVPWSVLPVALLQWPLLVRALNGVVIIGLAIALGADFEAAGFVLLLGIVGLGVLASLGVGLMAAAVKILGKRSDLVVTFYMLLTSVLSGAYFPIELLPAPIRIVSYLLPQTYALQAARIVLMEQGSQLPGPSLQVCVLALIFFGSVVLAASLWLYLRALENARRLGLLSGY